MKRLVVNAFCPSDKVISWPAIGGARLAIELCPCDLDQNTRSKDRVRGQIRSFRAVAQLGRAPGSGPGGRGFKSHQPDFNQLRSLRRQALGSHPTHSGLIDASNKAVLVSTTGVWHKRLYVVDVETGLSVC